MEGSAAVNPTTSKRITSIKILLAIDVVFFFVELISGYAVGSLALVADSFHMLNDVCSLIVALQAIKLAETAATHRYSYGWQRAEVLGALINGVFLLALCFSIGMEAIERFFNATVVSNPQLVVAVGSAGLLSNIVGLFLFHDHGHSHGGHSHGGHSHGHSHDLEAAKPKTTKAKKRNSLTPRPHMHHHESSDRTPLLATTPAFVPAFSTITKLPSGSAATTSTDAAPIVRTASQGSEEDEEEDDDDDEDEESEAERRRRAEDELFVHPTEFRAGVVRAAQDAGYGSTSTGGVHQRLRSMSGSSRKSAHDHSSHSHGHSHDHDHAASGHGHDHAAEGHDHDDTDNHEEHGGHSHEGSMNMRGVFLHVLGDALGNVGVIGAGLIIWLTDYSWKYYSDPAISLIITVIIFSSALPLVKSASFILLQGVPSSVPLEQVRTSISAIPGVLNVHELHIWSLSESKTVASVHVMVRNKDEFVEVSKTIRKVMHRFGIHSSTIQPEIASLTGVFSSVPHTASILDTDELGCLVQCVGDSCSAPQCCPTPVVAATTTSS